jgi:hypothetical protein
MALKSRNERTLAILAFAVVALALVLVMYSEWGERLDILIDRNVQAQDAIYDPTGTVR